MSPKPPFDRIATTSPGSISGATAATIASASACTSAGTPRSRSFAVTASGTSRSASAITPELKTPARTTRSASARLSTSASANTFRRNVFERGSSTAHNRRPGYA